MTDEELQALMDKVDALEDRVTDLEFEMSGLKHDIEHPHGCSCTSCD